MPKGRKVTNRQLVSNIRPNREETYQARLTVGGNRLEYPHGVSTPTTDLTIAKCLINSTLSTPNSKSLRTDIKYLYLNRAWNYMNT